MRPSLARLAAVAVAALVAACGDETNPPPPLAWSWVPIDGAVCSDGSPTGIGIEPGTSSDVLLFLNGGGACWDALTCFTFETATPGPYGAAQLDADVRALRAGSVLDREAAGNPYADFTFVFVPYCTGDVHTGDTVRSYPGAPSAWHHAGRANLAADFAHLGASLDAPAKVVVSGASAGGFGSLLAFDLAKQTWPSAQGYLVDDSGPPLAEIPDATVAAWYAQWDMGGAVTPLCGVDCAADLSLVFPALAARYPDDRLALLSSTQDEVIRTFFGAFTLAPPYITPMDPVIFEDGLRALAGRIEDDVAPGETHVFVVPGTTHTMLGSPGTFASEGIGLFEWLGQQVGDDPDWSSRVPLPL